MRVEQENSYTKISPFLYNGVVQATVNKKGKVIKIWLKKQSLWHIRSGCANITSSSHQSIDEK